MPHDLNCLTIEELQKLAAVRMDKQTRDYYNEVCCLLLLSSPLDPFHLVNSVSRHSHFSGRRLRQHAT